jgi:hypothetical protein
VTPSLYILSRALSTAFCPRGITAPSRRAEPYPRHRLADSVNLPHFAAWAVPRDQGHAAATLSTLRASRYSHRHPEPW